MKEIAIDPSRLSELEICPRQYYLRYEYESRYPKDMEDYGNEQELIERCIGDLLMDDSGTVNEVVAHNLEKMDRIFQPNVIKEVLMTLEEWSKGRRLHGALLDYNRSFVETFMLGAETVQISGLVHQVERLDDGTVKATIFKGENRLYTHNWMLKTYLPIIYALVIRKLYNADKIVISYFMVKHGSEVWVEFNEKDWDWQRQLVSIQLKKLMDGREDQAIVGSHCAYCPRKTVCNDYKDLIMGSFELRNIHELFNISMEEIIGYVHQLDAQRSLLKNSSEELKNILVQEVLNNGVDSREWGKYRVELDQKKTYDCNIEGILKVIKPKDHAKIVKIDKRKLDIYLNGLSVGDKVKIMTYCNIRFYKPTLKIKVLKEKVDEGKFKELLHF